MSTPKSIVVAGGNSKVGKLLIPLLADAGHSVTALVRAPQQIEHAAVVANWMANPDAAAAILAADVIVNLVGDINPKTRTRYHDANAKPALHLANARAGKPADLAIMIGWAGARPDASNQFHRTKARAEEATRQTARIATIFRPSSVMGTPANPWDFEEGLRTPAGKSAQAFGTGQVHLRPVLGSDLAKLVAAAVAHPTPGVFAAEGPDTLTLDDYVRLVNRDPTKPISHTPGWLATLLAPTFGMRRDMVRLFLMDALDTNPSAFTAFGLTATSVLKTWAPEAGQH